MNQRIQELARQADAYAWQQIDEGADYNKQPQFFAEKFAELIIRKCVKIAHPKLNDVGEWAAGMRLVQKRLKEHFGVEE